MVKKTYFQKGWATTFMITSYPAKISPGEGNRQIKCCHLYRNISQGDDVYGSVGPDGLNKEVIKYNRRVKVGCYLVNYEELEKTVPNSCFVVALLLGIGMHDKSSFISNELAKGKIDD